MCIPRNPKRARTAVTAALDNAVEDLRGRLGDDMTRWRWDAVHRAVFPHQGFDGIAPLRALLSRSVPNGGDWSTVNVGAVSTGQPYDQRSVAGYREIIDLSPANDSRFIIDLGQSGHPLSRHYDDFLQDWQQVRIGRCAWNENGHRTRCAGPSASRTPKHYRPKARNKTGGRALFLILSTLLAVASAMRALRRAAARTPGSRLWPPLASPPRRSRRDSCSAPPATGVDRRWPDAPPWSWQTGSCLRRSCRSAL